MCFLSCYVSTYIMTLILRLGSQSLKYLLPGPFLKKVVYPHPRLCLLGKDRAPLKGTNFLVCLVSSDFLPISEGKGESKLCWFPAMGVVGHLQVIESYW